LSTSDLQDKLTNSNLGNWFILLVNSLPISWTSGRYSSDTDHTLVNSNMLDKLSNAYFVDFPFYFKKTATDESFLLPKEIVVR